MGRKNKRTITEDKKFNKFIKTFMEEQKKKQINSVIESRKEFKSKYNKYNRRTFSNEELFNFTIEQLKANNISYKIIDKNKGLIHCKRKSDNYIFKFYAHSGVIVGFSDFNGIIALLILLKQNTEVNNNG